MEFKKSGIRGEFGLQGRILIEAFHKGSSVPFTVRKIHNLVVTAGKAEVAQLIGSGLGGTAFGWIGSGTGTTPADAADSDLGTQVGSKQVASVSNTTTTVTNDTAEFIATQAYTGTSAITEAGLFNNATTATGDMLARQVFSAINVVNGDSIKFTWDIIVG